MVEQLTINTLIALLEQYKREHGDLRVAVEDNDIFRFWKMEAGHVYVDYQRLIFGADYYNTAEEDVEVRF